MCSSRRQLQCLPHLSVPLLVIALLPATVHAQKMPDRPQLPPGGDPNDAVHYYLLAERLLQGAPAKAEQAYYWASRISPGTPNLLYGRWVARLMANPRQLETLFQGNERAMRSKEMIALDSLRLAFHTADPFLFGAHDQRLLRTYLNELVERELRLTGGVATADRAAIDYELKTYLNRLGPGFRAWLAYTERRFDDALSLYDRALRETKDRASLQYDRALALYHSGQYDGAVAALKNAVEERSKQQKDKFVRVHQSVASYEFMIGMALQMQNDVAARRRRTRARC